MEIIAKTTIPKHCVSADENGLSVMQAKALNSKLPFTLVSAPTGAGKSRIYQDAMMRGEYILFVVPTKRLSQNQVQSNRKFILDNKCIGFKDKDENLWTNEEKLIHQNAKMESERRVIAFTSDTTEAMRETLREEETVSGKRKLLMKRLHNYREPGGIIFCTPESISGLLLNNRNGLHGDFGVATLMNCFDRIVFDEMHTISARGFGLLAVLAKLAQDGPWQDSDGNIRAKVSALSATPIDIIPVLNKLGVNVTQDNIIQEVLIENGTRALHGDVQLEFWETKDLSDVIETLKSDIASLPDKETCAVIFDSLRNLKEQEQGIRKIAVDIGIDGSDLGLFIDNSLDSQIETQYTGRHKDFSARKLLISTSTIEVGVTLDGLTLLIMEPGMSPLSFMQRLGRVARKDTKGRVVVKVSPGARENKVWLNQIIEFISTRERTSIEELVSFTARIAHVQEKFNVDNNNMYGAMGMRAVYTSALYWHILIKAVYDKDTGNTASYLKGISQSLIACAPSAALKTMEDLFKEIEGSRVEGGKVWLKAFKAQGRIFRDFDPVVKVVNTDNNQMQTVSSKWLVNNTSIFDRYTPYWNEKNECVVNVDGLDWTQHIRKSGDFVKYSRSAMLVCNGTSIEVTKNPVETFKHASEKQKMECSGKSERVIDAAIKLVGYTGLVPYRDEEDVSSDSAII